MRRLAVWTLGALTCVVLSAAAPARGDVIRLAEVVVEGTPRGLVTIVVAVPAELRDETEITYEVRTSGAMEVLGHLTGKARSDGARARPIVLTLRVPAGADAGKMNAAEVLFRTATGRAYIVPIVLRVPVVRAVKLTGSREMRGLRTGDRLELTYRVTNSGNAPDTLVVEARGPTGWSVRVLRPARMIVPARGRLEFDVRVFVPPATNVGDHQLAVSLFGADGGDALSTVHTTLGVTGRAGQMAGLVLRPSIAAATSSAGSATITSAVLEGPVATGMYLRAQLSPNASRGGITTQGLAAVGAMTSPFAASLTGERWDIAAGHTGLQLSALSGVNLMGQGLSGHLETDRYEARGIVAQPSAGPASDGRLIGAGLWRQTTRGRFGGQLSTLSERGGYSGARELTAIGADYLSPLLGTVRVGGGLAHRTMRDESGVGYTLNASHERPSDRATLSVSHAPGGTAGFARAVDEWQFDGARVLNKRWSLDANASHSRDAGAVFSGMDVTAWSLGNRYALKPDLSLHLRGQSSRFTARAAASSIGDFGAAERRVTGGTEWRRGLVSMSAEGSVGVVMRSAELLGGRVYETSATQRGVRLGAMRAFERWGAVDVNASLESTAKGVGLPGSVLASSARWSGIPIVLAGRQMRLNTEASYQRLGDMQRALVTRATLIVALPLGLDLAMSAERNPFYRDAQGRAGWIAAVRVSAAARVFTPKALGPEGVVFEDRNMNGRHDAGEPGVDGVIVRRGDARATTDQAGRYRLPVQSRGRTRIDQGTLPLGLIAHPLLAADTLERLDLPVLPTGTLTVELDLVADEGGRVPTVDLQAAIVLMRDVSGFEWVGRRTSPTTAVFDGVPSGEYTLHFNFDGLREMLRVDEATRVILAPHEVRTLTVPLRGRAVRIFTPEGSRRSSGSRP